MEIEREKDEGEEEGRREGGEGYNHLQIVDKHKAFFTLGLHRAVWSLGISCKSGKECDSLPRSLTCVWMPSFASGLNGILWTRLRGRFLSFIKKIKDCPFAPTDFSFLVDKEKKAGKKNGSRRKSEEAFEADWVNPDESECLLQGFWRQIRS